MHGSIDFLFTHADVWSRNAGIGSDLVMVQTDADSLDDSSGNSPGSGTTDDADESLFSDEEEYIFEEEMHTKGIDEVNARTVYEDVSESLIESIYERSSSLRTTVGKEFVLQLCRTSRVEISNYGEHVSSGQ
jgi:hypothetical protein